MNTTDTTLEIVETEQPAERGTACAATLQLASAAARAEVYGVALTTVCDLAPWQGDPQVALFAGTPDALQLVAVDGLCADWPLGEVRAAEEWGDSVAEAMLGPAPVFHPASPVYFRAPGGTSVSALRSELVQPVVLGGRLRGAILIVAAGPLAHTVRTGVDAVAFELALALDRLDHLEACQRRRPESRVPAFVPLA